MEDNCKITQPSNDNISSSDNKRLHLVNLTIIHSDWLLYLPNQWMWKSKMSTIVILKKSVEKPNKRFSLELHLCINVFIPSLFLQHIRNVAWSVAVGFQLQKNDVILVDNERLAHARCVSPQITPFWTLNMLTCFRPWLKCPFYLSRLNYTGDRKLFAALLNEADEVNGTEME